MFKWKKSADLNSKAFFKSWQAYTVLVVAMGAMMFFGVCHPGQDQMWVPGGAAAVVDGVELGAMDFRRAHVALSNQMQQQYRDKFDPVALRVSEQTLNSLVDNLTLYVEASKNGFYASDEEIEKVILDGDYFKGENGRFDPNLFQRFLTSQGHTEKSFTDELRRNIVSSKLRTFVTNTYRSSDKVAAINYMIDQTKLNVEFVRLDPNSVPVKVEAAEIEKFLKEGGEAQVKDYYEKNKSEFVQDKKVKARHILIAYKDARAASGDAAKRSKEEAKQLASKVEAEAKAPGANFAKLAEKYTDEAAGKAKGGDLGFFRQDQMVKEFSDVAFALQPGQVSGVVETPFGFHIIRVDSVQEPKSVSLEAAKNEIAEKLIARERKPKLLEEKAKELHAALREGKGQEQLSALGLAWKETGEFNLGARVVPGGIGPDPELRQAILALKKPGDIAPQPLEASGSYYVLRLKSRTDADMSKMDSAQKEQLLGSSRFMEAYGLYTALASGIRSRYEQADKIYRNPEYLQYDAKLRGQGAS